MRYDELLENDEYKQVREIFEKISQDCSPYLKSKKPASNLVRGDSQFAGKEIVYNADFTGLRREDFVYTKSDVAQMIHEYLNNKGFKATRMRGKFTYKDVDNGGISRASAFDSNVFFCFPVGTDWEITYMRGEELGFFGGDYGDNQLYRQVRVLYEQTHPDESVLEVSDEKLMTWFLETHGDIFKHGQNIEALKTDEESILYSPNVHLINSRLFKVIKTFPELMSILYDSLN